MDLDEVFNALRRATITLAYEDVKLVETPVDEEGNEGEEEETTISLQTYIVRAFGETLVERYGKTIEEIKEALGEDAEEPEIPKDIPYGVIMGRFGGKRRKTRRTKHKPSLK